MARKNLFNITITPQQEDADTAKPTLSRPLMGLDRAIRPSSPVGAISQSLENINSRAHRADEIEKQLAQGQSIVELDPDLVDSSFVVDRLGVNRDDQLILIAQIQEHGQQVPILVRPHPERDGRYQVAYGHRRLSALRELGRTVKAVVRDLTDDQLVVSQGQENNARTDLSFIERCFFAWRLETTGFTRETIMSALGVDKSALSRMIGLVARLPAELIEAVGAAPSFGRQRWAEVADLLADKSKRASALKLITTLNFAAYKSDDRFQKLYEALKTRKVRPEVRIWASHTGVRPVRITTADQKTTFAFNERIAPEFASFVEAQLEALFDEYNAKTNKDEQGD